MKNEFISNIKRTECDSCAACSVDRNAPDEAKMAKNSRHGWLSYLPLGKSVRLVIGILFFILVLVLNLNSQLNLILYLLAYAVLGYDVIFRALTWKGKKTFFDEHFLMTVATLGAFAIGEYPEAVAVMLFYQAGELLQSIAVGHSRRSIKALQAIKPDQANLVTEKGIVQSDPELVAAGSKIIVRPGERVPLDSVILDGESELDTAAITGESLPRPVRSKDEILAGSINGSGKITARVLRPAADSAVSRILELVEQASSRKAPAEKFISRFAAVYTPLMIALALIIGLIIPTIFQLSYNAWIYRALVVLVVSCPCALVISVPLGYFAGIGVLSRKGVLIKGGTYIEQMARTKKIAFDKTGTLTEGKFSVEQIEPYQGSVNEIMEMAAAAESHSSHPLAISLLRYFRSTTSREIDDSLIDSIREFPGKGILTLYKGQKILAGNQYLMQEHAVEVPQSWLNHENEEGAILHVARDNNYMGRIRLTDRLKSGVDGTIHSLQAMNIDLLLLSGDRKEAVTGAAKSLQINNYRFGLLPDEKVAALESWMESVDSQGKGSTIYIGDGINDAPVLARADVGIAMGNGSDAATENADGVIMSGDVNKLPEAIILAKKTSAIIRQNVTMAIGFKALILVLALFGLSSIWQAVFADVGITIMAVLNSVRLLSRINRNRQVST